MADKKLNSLDALAKIQFDNLAPNHDPLSDAPDEFIKQYLEAHFSNKGRGGKTVTIIKGFNGDIGQLKQLSKKLKQFVGVGGTTKNNEIIIQGNYRNTLIKLLTSMGHQVKRVGG